MTAESICPYLRRPPAASWRSARAGARASLLAVEPADAPSPSRPSGACAWPSITSLRAAATAASACARRAPLAVGVGRIALELAFAAARVARRGVPRVVRSRSRVRAPIAAIARRCSAAAAAWPRSSPWPSVVGAAAACACPRASLAVAAGSPGAARPATTPGRTARRPAALARRPRHRRRRRRDADARRRRPAPTRSQDAAARSGAVRYRVKPRRHAEPRSPTRFGTTAPEPSTRSTTVESIASQFGRQGRATCGRERPRRRSGRATARSRGGLDPRAASDSSPSSALAGPTPGRHEPARRDLAERRAASRTRLRRPCGGRAGSRAPRPRSAAAPARAARRSPTAGTSRVASYRAVDLVGGERRSLAERRQPRRPQDLVAVAVADAGHERLVLAAGS